MLNLNIILVILQAIMFSAAALFGYGLGYTDIVIYTTLASYVISFFIVNYKKENYLNLSTFFLIGFGLLILGRFIAYLIYPSRYMSNEILCFDFFFSYCLTNIELVNLLLFYHITILIFSFGYIKSIKIKAYTYNTSNLFNKKISIQKIKIFLLPVSYFCLLVLFYQSINTINLALSGGYMALYANQAEIYQTPFTLIANTTLIAMLAIIFKNGNDKIVNLHFKIIFYSLIFLGLISILSGSRNGFIGALFVLLWYFFYDKKIPKLYYGLIALLGVVIMASINYLANISGVRSAGVESNLQSNIAEAFFSQGGTFFLVNEVFKMDEVPFLGYIKTIIPGVQVFFTSFGITERYMFDWGSNLAYRLDKGLYQSGFGLGWSIFADFYLLAFGFVPVYLVLIFFWGRVLNILDTQRTQFVQALSFIFAFYVFALPRNSISPLLFTILIYIILVSLFKMRIKK
ncbi:O-antigen polysaccharide polymerase Wzy [Acinetobacter towneri]|uniref:O-antigen polysaccharide polymerase Wzy n=1 Tax=Acinetobacter towneri TaxID=202956 RepID=UPI002578A737|nr:O-antigen polysaccharide polymerase Wzy [Acinetobacter towneri]MDM1754640.1 O-antigen polysaccharide polymerase Wzy [Acinetobacter towneri]